MTTVSELRARVAERYSALDLPSWPPPRDPMASPESWEYSRVTDGDRYRIVHARGRIWAEVLGELPGVAVVEHDGPAGPTDPAARLSPDRTATVRHEGPGLATLVLRETDGRGSGAGATVPCLAIAVADERVSLGLAWLPDCGCDACDDGSEHYLGAVDEAIVRVLSEPVVLLRGTGWHAEWSPSRWGHGHGPEGRGGLSGDAAVEVCRQIAAGEAVDLPRGTAVVHSRPWPL